VLNSYHWNGLSYGKSQTDPRIGVLALAVAELALASCELANLELRADLRDIAAQNAPESAWLPEHG